jgi:arylsulfatase A-like enzyme
MGLIGIGAPVAVSMSLVEHIVARLASLPGAFFLSEVSARGTPADAERRPVFLELAPPKPFRWAVVDGDRKLIVDPATPSTPELYDLKADPGERSNLAAREPAEVERLRDLLRAWARRNPRAPDQRTRDRLDDDLRKELEALGYLGGTPPPAPPAAPPPR